jgi:glycosyltransferase involved in cell wall biosynthesis
MPSRTRAVGVRSAAAKRARVLMLVTRNQRRGAESFAAALSTVLGDLGLDVRLVSLADGGGEPIPGMTVLGRRELSLPTLARLRREMAASDVVLACGSRTLPAAALAGLGTGCPVVYQNIGDPLFWTNRRGRRLRVRLLLRRMTAVAALTETSRDVLAAHFGVAGDRIKVIHNARDVHAFRPPTLEEKVQARRDFGLPRSGAVVSVVGALSPEKRVDVAIAAMSELPAQVHLAVAGVGPLRGELERAVRTTAPGRVTFLGQVTELPRLLWASDLVLLTSDTEGVPGVLIEAGLSGLPVVATDVGYVRDVVVPGRTGHVVPRRDPAAIGKAVMVALDDADALGDEARRHCVEMFDMASVSEQYARLLRSTAGVPTEVRV